MLIYSETPNLHTHTLKVAVIDASRIRRRVRFRGVPCASAPPAAPTGTVALQARQHPVAAASPDVAADCEVDLDYHLRRVQVPAPGGRRELDQVIGEVASTPLDRSRPLWEFHFAEGLADDRFAVIGKVHHALADGVASVNLLARAMDLSRRVETSAATTGAIGPQRVDGRFGARRRRATTSGNSAELPRLVRDAVAGMTRVRRRSRRRGEHPDLADSFDAPPDFPQPCGVAAAPVRQRRHCRWPRSKRPPRRWASRSTT